MAPPFNFAISSRMSPAGNSNFAVDAALDRIGI
jgi:hypothetical protein